MIRLFLSMRRRMLQNQVGALEHPTRRSIALVALALLFWAGIYAVSHWFILQTLAMEPIGELVVRHLLAMALFFIFVILIFSNLVAAFSSFFLADDLQLLMTSPLRKNPFFTVRFMENAATASWMTLVFGLAPFIAMGVLMRAPVDYYFNLVFVFFSLFVVPSAIAIVLALVLCTVFSARRARHVILFIGGFAFVAILLMFRSLAPEELLRTEMRGTLMETLSNLEGPSQPWMMTTWAHDILWGHLNGTAMLRDGNETWLLLSVCGAAFFVAAWAFRALHALAFSRAQEGLAAGMIHNVDQALVKQKRAHAKPIRPARPGRMRLFEVLWRKDAKTFVRDTAQWSQILLVVALVAMYVLNFSFIEKVVQGGIISSMTLHFLNMVLSGFVVVAMSARFVFPLISLEGKAFWLIRSSPHPIRNFLSSKWRAAVVPFIVVANLLVVLTNWVVDSSWVMTVCASVTVTLMTAGIVGLAVGLGARFPRFHVDNAAKITTGFGGVLYMMLATTYVLLMLALSVQPILVLYRLEAGTGGFSGPPVLYFFLCLFLLFLAPGLVVRSACGAGAHHLETKD